MDKFITKNPVTIIPKTQKTILIALFVTNGYYLAISRNGMKIHKTGIRMAITLTRIYFDHIIGSILRKLAVSFQKRLIVYLSIALNLSIAISRMVYIETIKDFAQEYSGKGKLYSIRLSLQ